VTTVEPSAKGKEKRQTLSATAVIPAAIAQPDASDAGRRRITSAARRPVGVGFWAVREEAIRKEVRESPRRTLQADEFLVAKTPFRDTFREASSVARLVSPG